MPNELTDRRTFRKAVRRDITLNTSTQNDEMASGLYRIAGSRVSPTVIE